MPRCILCGHDDIESNLEYSIQTPSKISVKHGTHISKASKNYFHKECFNKYLAEGVRSYPFRERYIKPKKVNRHKKLI